MPYLRCVLCFVVEKDRILLIEKLRGFGAGKVNGPGGKIDPGERPKAAAIRETEEEVGVRPAAPRRMGELWFRFLDGLKIHCVVYRADRFDGELRQTAEAIPFWSPLDAIPYGRMWQDDPHWLPLLIAGKRFTGRFLFDGERLVRHAVRTISP